MTEQRKGMTPYPAKRLFFGRHRIHRFLHRTARTTQDLIDEVEKITYECVSPAPAVNKLYLSLPALEDYQKLFRS